MQHPRPPAPAPSPAALWREYVLPREHGSWSLALEPLALGLLVAPSLAGAGLALAAVAGFFARRPLRIAVGDPSPERRRLARGPLAVCTLAAVAALGGAVTVGGVSWLAWLLPAAGAGAVFLFFDLRRAGREEAAEIAGAAAFAWLPAALAVLAGWSAPAAAALGAVALGRAVPTVLSVRAVLRAAKTGEWRRAPALVTTLATAVGGGALAQAGLAPWTAAALLALLAVRSLVLLVWPRPALRASALGLIEAVLGGAFVLGLAVAWRA